jgi:hypothetical protein
VVVAFVDVVFAVQRGELLPTRGNVVITPRRLFDPNERPPRVWLGNLAAYSSLVHNNEQH